VIVTSVAGAKVIMDGKPAADIGADGKSSLQVEPGAPHSIQVSRDGYEPNSKTVTVKAGDRKTVAIAMKEIAKPLPSILAFAADKTQIQAGSSATLKWDTKDATEVQIDGQSQPASGSKAVSPGSDTTYSLVAVGAGGKSPAQKVTIKVAAAVVAIPKPAINNFDLGSESIQAGEKVKLIWSTQNADSVTIDPEVGTQKANGSVNVSPSKTTTYTLTAKGPGGTVTSSPQTLTVEAKAVVTAPTVTQTQPAAPDDNSEIKDLLEHTWAGAFNSKNLGAAKNIWPNIPTNLQDAVRNSQGVKINLSCTPQVSGEKATARCSQTTNMNGKAGPSSTVNFSLSKSGGSWKIESSR
jgi:hypothetical protein